MKKPATPIEKQSPRIKVVMFIVFAGIITLFLPAILRKKIPTIDQPSQISAPPTNAVAVNKNFEHAPAHPVTSRKKHTPESDAEAINPADTENENYVAGRVAELHDLAMTDDSNSLVVIISELDSRDPRIRKAALDATVQFGSRDAIPALQDELNRTDEPEEKVDLQKAIDFLALPTMSEAANAQADESGGGGN
jgi:hypothetical protein